MDGLSGLKNLFRSYAGILPDAVEEFPSSGSDRRYFRLTANGFQRSQAGVSSDPHQSAANISSPSQDNSFGSLCLGNNLLISKSEPSANGDSGKSAITVIGVIGTDKDENMAFVGLARHFASKGLKVPSILAVSEDYMSYIQEDLGDASLFGLVSKGREAGTYSEEEREVLLRTISKLPEIQFRGAEGLDWSLCYPEPSFSGRLVMFDLNYFKYCFLKVSGLSFHEGRLQDDFERLRDDLLAADDCGNTFMYRDFQARNVMVRDGEPYFIDFQGGRRGPIYYDLASFVWQARSRYPEDLKREMIEAYLASLSAFTNVDRDIFDKRLRLFVLFRTLQVLGAYGFRGFIEGKAHFIASIRPALENLRQLISKPFPEYPYLTEVLQRLSSENLPRLSTAEAPAHSPSLPPAPSQPLPLPTSSVPVTSPSAETSKVQSSPPPSVHSSTGSSSDKAAEPTQPSETESNPTRLLVEVKSFSFKRGIPEDKSGNGGGYVFDCRAVNNPGRIPYYRNFTGLDKEVIDFLENDGGITVFLDSVYKLIDSHVEEFLRRGFTHLQVSFGCTGGQHRSVYSAEHLARHIISAYPADVLVEHRELSVKTLLHGLAKPFSAGDNECCGTENRGTRDGENSQGTENRGTNSNRKSVEQ